jgi:hypothetical protein
MIVYRSHDDGEIYSEELIKLEWDVPESGSVEGFDKYEIDDKFELTASDCLGHYADITGILLDAKKMRKL